jgi:hypothetical protein
LEFFEAVHRRLAPSGLFALWIPSYQIGAAELESVMAAFRQVFPSSEAWRHGLSDRRAVIGLFGYRAPSLPMPIPAERLAALRAHTRFPKDHWPDIDRLSQLRLGSLPELLVVPNSELRPIVELRAGLSRLLHQELSDARTSVSRALLSGAQLSD